MYCPATHVVHRGALARSKAFVQTHIAVAEYLWCMKRGLELTTVFFQRRADAYKEVSRLIQDPNAEFDAQICGLISLQHAECIVVRSDLQTVHLNAMSQFVERKGGIACFLNAKNPDQAVIEPIFYSIQFMFSECQQLNGHVEEIIQQFISDLKYVQKWNHNVMKPRSATLKDSTFPSEKDQREQWELRNFNDHIHFLVNEYLGNQNQPYFLAAGIFYFIYSICITLVELKMDLAQARQFLLEIHRSLQLITETSYRLRFAVAALLVSYIRCQPRSSYYNNVNSSLSSENNTTDNDRKKFNVEVTICESCMNVMYLFPSLSPGTRMQVGKVLLQNLMCVMDLSSDEPFDDLNFEELRLEILRTETVRRKVRRISV